MRGACLEYRIEAKFNKGLPGNNLWAHIRHGPGGNYGLQLKHWRFSREEMLCPLVISFLRHHRWYGLRHRPTLSHLFKDLNGGCSIRKTMVMFAKQPHIQLRFWVFSYLKWMQSNYRGGLKYGSQVPWIWSEKVAFSCLQQAGERNFFLLIFT